MYWARDGNELRYVRRGQGPPVPLLHGWPGFWYDWRRLIRPLSADVDVLAPDFRGFGDSPLPRGPAERTSGEGPLADDLARLMDDLGVRGSVVVGLRVRNPSRSLRRSDEDAADSPSGQLHTRTGLRAAPFVG